MGRRNPLLPTAYKPGRDKGRESGEGGRVEAVGGRGGWGRKKESDMKYSREREI